MGSAVAYSCGVIVMIYNEILRSISLSIEAPADPHVTVDGSGGESAEF